MLIWFVVFALAVAMVLLSLRVERTREKYYALHHGVRDVERSMLTLARAAVQGEVRRELDRAGVTPRLPVEFRAGEGEDLFLWTLLEGQRTGTFIECGAYDGERFSVTYIFEAVGWGGVLIEALPNLFEVCRQKRPGSRVVHAALSKRGSTGTAEFLAFGSETTDDSMSTLAGSARSNIRAMRRTTKISVPLTTMDEVLGAAGAELGRVDVAVLDVEGGELDLLDGFDLERHGVRVLLIEELTAGEDRSLRALMDGRGYEFVTRVGRNDVFITRGEPGLIHRARQLSTLV